MRRVAVTATTSNTDYSFFLPIITQLWKRCGYELYCFYVKDAAWDSAASVLVRQEATAQGAQLCPISQLEGYNDSTVAQVSRLACAAVPVAEEDLLLTTDIDMLPLSFSFYNLPDLTASLTTYFSNAYLPTVQYPICHIVARRKVWRDLTWSDTTDADVIVQRILTELNAHAEKMTQWLFDERWITQRILKSSYVAQAQHVLRSNPDGMPATRIDRGRAVQHNPTPALAEDCHSWRPAWDQHNWTLLWPVLEYHLSQQLDWLQQYRQQFVQTLA